MPTIPVVRPGWTATRSGWAIQALAGLDGSDIGPVFSGGTSLSKVGDSSSDFPRMLISRWEPRRDRTITLFRPEGEKEKDLCKNTYSAAVNSPRVAQL